MNAHAHKGFIRLDTIEQVIFVRHGLLLVGNPDQLTPESRAAAYTLGERIARSHSTTAVLTSSSMKAKRVAEAIALGCGVPAPTALEALESSNASPWTRSTDLLAGIVCAPCEGDISTVVLVTHAESFGLEFIKTFARALFGANIPARLEHALSMAPDPGAARLLQRNGSYAVFV
jgi:hypothetical protein